MDRRNPITPRAGLSLLEPRTSILININALLPSFLASALSHPVFSLPLSLSLPLVAIRTVDGSQQEPPANQKSRDALFCIRGG